MRVLFALLATPALAQSPPTVGVPSNAEVFGRLAVTCVAEVPLDGPVRVDVAAPYLRSPVVTALLARSASVATSDTTAARLAVVPELQTIAYARAGRNRLRRTATVRYRLTLDARGQRRYDRACTASASDELAARDRRRLEDPAWPETVGTGPAASTLARAVQTGLAAGAVVASTLLLFSLRSR